jgi:GT2 family glycosyltransferase/peptidoglycan/xylan/chitin deacetylase (PgdA/CDA1 family)
VIPTYQRRDTVVRTVTAFDGQSSRDFEVIVVDDGSTDDTAAALRELQVGFPLMVIEQENQGGAAARNTGAAAATGEMLLFLDDDMEALPSLLAEHDRSRDEGAELVLGDIPLHHDSPRNVLSRGVGDWAASRRQRLTAPGAVPRIDDLITGQMSISRDAFQRVGGFDTQFTRDGLYGGEDLDFGYRVTKAGYRIAFNPYAISYQYYDVDPADFLRRAYETGRSEAELSIKHPGHNGPLGRDRRYHGRLGRWILGPLASAPAAVTRPLRTGASAAVRTGRGGRTLHKLFRAVRTMEHLRGAHDARRALSTGDAVVLAYHAVADLSRDPVLSEFGVPAERFSDQLDALLRHGWRFVDLDTLLSALAGDRQLPRRAVLLTFDDAYKDLEETALPVLRDRGIPAVAFVVAGQIGGTNGWDHAIGALARPLLGKESLRNIARLGIEIGSHTLSHRRLPQVPASQVHDELAGSASQVEALGLPRPRVLAYPHGAWSPQIAAAVHDAGYEAAFTVAAGAVSRSSPRYALPRIEVYASDTPWRLRLKVAIAGWPERPRRWTARLFGVRL